MSHSLSRRDFLKIGGLAAGIMLQSRLLGRAPRLAQAAPSLSREGFDWVADFGLGRAARSLKIYQQPSTASTQSGYYSTDSVFKVLEEKWVENGNITNPLWLRSEKGWVNAGYVQPVRQELNTPVDRWPGSNFLAEVTVPYADAWRYNDDERKRAYRLYYATTYWVTYVSKDKAGNVWYRLLDDLDESLIYTPGKYLRLVNQGELTPLSPGASGKRIEVDLKAQQVTAYENSRQVFSAFMASGDDGSETPQGEFRVERKMASRHMAGDTGNGRGYNLPGVPWVCFISWNGVSLHGTYWHNNYGEPQSHGCINLRPEAAKWLYRWSDPVVPTGKSFVASKEGTPVVVR